MALIFMDGFDHYLTSHIVKKWTANGGAVIVPSGGRRGGGAVNLYAAYVFKSLATPASSFVMGFALNLAALPSSGSFVLVSLREAAAYQCEVRVHADGTLSVTRNGAALSNGASAAALSPNTWHYLEWKVTIANAIAADSCVVRLDGAQAINVAAGQETQAGANASANQVYLGHGSYASGMSAIYCDDFYLCDQAGSVNNDFLGDVRIDVLAPSGSGTYNDFTQSVDASELAASYPYWRVCVKAWESNLAYRLYEIELRATVGGADQCEGGTASASSGAAANAFDNNTGTYCGFNAGEQWIQYAFGTPVSVAEIELRSASNYGPSEFWLQASHDGTSFKTLGVYRPVAWTTLNPQRFELVGHSDVSLVNDAYPDNGGTYLAGGAAGTKESFTLAPTTDLPMQDLVVAVQVNNYAAKSDAGGAVARNLIRAGAAEAAGPNQALSTSYLYVRSIHELNPATGQPWLLSEALAMEAGLEVVS